MTKNIELTGMMTKGSTYTFSKVEEDNGVYKLFDTKGNDYIWISPDYIKFHGPDIFAITKFKITRAGYERISRKLDECVK